MQLVEGETGENDELSHFEETESKPGRGKRKAENENDLL